MQHNHDCPAAHTYAFAICLLAGLVSTEEVAKMLFANASCLMCSLGVPLRLPCGTMVLASFSRLTCRIYSAQLSEHTFAVCIAVITRASPYRRFCMSFKNAPWAISFQTSMARGLAGGGALCPCACSECCGLQLYVTEIVCSSACHALSRTSLWLQRRRIDRIEYDSQEMFLMGPKLS